MYKMFAIYKKPEEQDIKSFDDYFQKHHLPLVRKKPGLKEIRLNRIVGQPRGESDLHLIVELSFETKESFDNAMKSPEAQAAGKDLKNFAKGLINVHFAEETISDL